MTDNGSPKMSVIILTPDCYETIRKTMRCLRAQSACDQLEIIIVASSASGLFDGEMELAEFNDVRVIEIGPINSTPGARAVGVRHAAASVVAFAGIARAAAGESGHGAIKTPRAGRRQIVR